MPIKPPNLDDRRYVDLVAEARALIPQYCPEWTNLNDADPGMTLVQLFAWMTEMIVYRLNRVPDKTYIHFLNFIGEERRPARPAVAPVTFASRSDDPVDLPAFTRVATRQREDQPALPFVTVSPLTVHSATVKRVMAVRGGNRPAVREIPFTLVDGHPSALAFGAGRGVQVFDLDPVEAGPESYTPHQYLYVNHDDVRLMNFDPEKEDRPVGRLHVRRTGAEGLSVVSLFDWEYPTEEGWAPIALDAEPEEVLGMPVVTLQAALPGIRPLEDFHLPEAAIALPEAVKEERWWIRGRLAYERWLARRMQEDLEVSWRDDRGGAARPINNWEVNASGRSILFALQDVPPIRGGWTVRLALVDRGLPAGRNGYLPTYRWSYRRGDTWESIPSERVRMENSVVVLTGPMTDMATDGYNLRAERIETVYLRGICPDLDLDLTWIRPVEISMFAGDDPRRLEAMLLDEGPWSPFQMGPTLPPTIGRKWYIGSDLFENRRQAPVLVELEVAFEVNGEPVAEPVGDYVLQLTYRAQDNWRVVWSEDKRFAGFTFASFDEEGAKKPGRRRIRIVLDPKTALKGLARHEVGGRESTWIRFEMTKSNLTVTDKEKNRHPVVPRIYGVRLGPDKTLGDGTFEQPMPGPKMSELDYRPQNQRLTRILTRATGRLAEHYPFYPFIELDQENLSFYLELDRPIPRADRHSIHLRCRGESFLPAGTQVDWEVLEQRDFGRTAWQRIRSSSTPQAGGDQPVYDFTRTGEFAFAYPDPPPTPEDGFWMRARFVLPEGMAADRFPALPPLTHLLLNTVDAVNLWTLTTERFSGYGVPHQVLQLRRHPIYVHHGESERIPFPRPDAFTDIRVWVEGEDGNREEWLPARDGNLLTATKDDRLFLVDPVEGTLTFGNGIRGRMLPVGNSNVVVDVYHVIPGASGNVAAGAVQVVEDRADLVKATNLLPSTGGRDAETIEEIVRRAPSLLTSRDRAVTRSDFEVIAREASGEVSRASCTGEMQPDGSVEVVILPTRREGEETPDPFLSTGLRDHVQAYLKRRCLVNVDPVVRLARFRPIDVSVTLRLRPNANILVVREQAIAWIRRFLDPYDGGFDRDGWPFGGTLYAQDLARLVADLADVRHVAAVRLYDMADPARQREGPGWEQGEGVESIEQTGHDLFVVRRIRVLAEEISA
ncbi:MAG: putative baseplate assembly protein [Deltaproteobacteria bacterium]|nr:putative baseplate assembly protein [Deltaproteobacteria bacterium]